MPQSRTSRQGATAHGGRVPRPTKELTAAPPQRLREATQRTEIVSRPPPAIERFPAYSVYSVAVRGSISAQSVACVVRGYRPAARISDSHQRRTAAMTPASVAGDGRPGGVL